MSAYNSKLTDRSTLPHTEADSLSNRLKRPKGIQSYFQPLNKLPKKYETKLSILTSSSSCEIACSSHEHMETEPDEPVNKDTLVKNVTSNFQNDISLFIGKHIDDHTKCHLLESPWKPPNNYEFPYSIHIKNGKEERRFVNRSHLLKYPWLVISPTEKGLYCKFCTLFVTGNVGGFQKNITLQKFVVTPLKSFAKLLGKDGLLETHSKNTYHQQAVEAGRMFLETFHKPNKDVINQVNKQRLTQVNENRARLKPIIHSILFLGRQNIALRGDRDDGQFEIPNEMECSAVNKGNFRELLRYRVQSGDKTLEEHLKSANEKATYISKTTQNTLIECIGEEICFQVLSKINESGIYSIIFDETTDVSHISQLSIVVRYVTEGKIREDFVEFIDAYGNIKDKYKDQNEPVLSGTALGQLVLDRLKKLNLNVSNCVGIGTDGCSVMLSEICGAVAEVKKEAKIAVRCPCYSHALNLSLSKSSSVQSVRNATGTMKEVISFFNASAKRNTILKDVLQGQMLGLCETRWVERHRTVMQFKASLTKLIEALEIISNWRELESSSKANSLVAALCSSEFIVTIVCMTELLSLTLPLSRYLQKESITVDKASSLISDTINSFCEKRENVDYEFHNLYEQCCTTAESLGINISMPRLTQKQKQRSNHPASGPEEYFRRSIFIPLLESITEDLKTRFPKETVKLYGLTSLIPVNMAKDSLQDPNSEQKIKTILKEAADKFQPLLKTHGEVCQDIIFSEYILWRKKWVKIPKEELPSNALAAHEECDGDIYPIVKSFLQILATMPSSVASAERSFSTLRRLKTWIRSRMGEERLVGLALMNIHRDISVDLDKVINRFAKQKNRRLEFVI